VFFGGARLCEGFRIPLYMWVEVLVGVGLMVGVWFCLVFGKFCRTIRLVGCRCFIFALGFLVVRFLGQSWVKIV
jgi:hypothetical protein